MDPATIGEAIRQARADAAKKFYTKTTADLRYAGVGGVSSARVAMPRTVAITPFNPVPAHPIINSSASALTTSNSRVYRAASKAWGISGTATTTEISGALHSKQTGCSSNYETIMWGPEFTAIGGDATNQIVEVGFALAPGVTQARLIIEEDGKRYTIAPEDIVQTSAGVALAGGTAYVVQLSVPINTLKRFRVLGSRWRINWVRVPLKSIIAPVNPDRYRIAVFGASFVASDYSWAHTMGLLLGADVFQCGQAGTGFNNPGTTTDTTSDGGVYITAARLAALIATRPNLIMLEDSGNDRPMVTDLATYNQLVAARKAFFAAVTAALPGVPIIVNGIPPRGYTDTVSNSTAWCLAAMRQAINESPTANIIGYHDYLGTVVGMQDYTALRTAIGTGSVPAGTRCTTQGAVWECTGITGDGTATTLPTTIDTSFWRMFGWYTGTGRIGATTGNGTRDVLMGEGADETHPSPFGYVVEANTQTPDVQADLTRNTRVGTLTRAQFELAA